MWIEYCLRIIAICFKSAVEQIRLDRFQTLLLFLSERFWDLHNIILPYSLVYSEEMVLYFHFMAVAELPSETLSFFYQKFEDGNA
jgi:hypothetical protein